MRAPPSPIVVHVPHSSTEIPPDVRETIVLDDEALELELLRMTDWYTDELFDVPGTVMVRYPVSRLVVDPERFLDDAQEPMAGKGMGAVYTHTSHLTLLRPAPSQEQRRRWIDRFYTPHHLALERAVDAALDAFGHCLVVDGHSFPSKPSPYEDHQGLDRPDLCIGTDEFHTPESLAVQLEKQAMAAGLRVARDTPFSGALVPLKHYGRDARVRAVMIEVNRGSYMNEATGEKSPAFDGIEHSVQNLVSSCGPRSDHQSQN